MTIFVFFVILELVKKFKSFTFLTIIIGAISFIFLSCGTETTYYLLQPKSLGKEPNHETQYDEAYFEFEALNQDVEGFKYNGTAVYYKIYTNWQDIESRKSSIDTLNESDNESSAASSVINSYGYKQLGTSHGIDEPLIGSSGGHVKIRLNNYLETQLSGGEYEDYQHRAYIKINDEDTGIPLRVENKHTFDFGRKDDEINLVPGAIHKVDKDVKNAIPKSDDEEGDVYYSSFSDSENHIWYVDMYAISMGRDNNFVKYYSKVLYLGCVPIDASMDYK